MKGELQAPADLKPCSHKQGTMRCPAPSHGCTGPGKGAGRLAQICLGSREHPVLWPGIAMKCHLPCCLDLRGKTNQPTNPFVQHFRANSSGDAGVALCPCGSAGHDERGCPAVKNNLNHEPRPSQKGDGAQTPELPGSFLLSKHKQSRGLASCEGEEGSAACAEEHHNSWLGLCAICSGGNGAIDATQAALRCLRRASSCGPNSQRSVSINTCTPPATRSSSGEIELYSL